MQELSAPLLHKHAQELRDMWQARCLAEAKGKLAAVVMVVLFHSYTAAMPILLRVVFPGFRDLARPFLCSGATIAANGNVVCDLVNRDGRRVPNALIYDSEAELIKDFRTLADRLKLSDVERVQMTEALKRWVVCDLRVNHLGEKVA